MRVHNLYKAIDEHNLIIVSKKIKDDFVVVCANVSHPESVLPTYKTRWSIEWCFKNMKSQGFNLENTHMTCQERLKKLMTIVAVAMLWSALAGTLVSSPFKKTVRSPLYNRKRRHSTLGYLAPAVFEKQGLHQQNVSLPSVQ